MAQTIEQRVAQLERVAGTLRARLLTCRRKHDEQKVAHAAALERHRVARNEYKDQRDRLRKHMAILAASGAHGRYCGVYLLIKLGVCLYVGQSVNVFSRVAFHRGANSWPTSGDFDEVRVIWCAVEELNTTERQLIEQLQPRLNRAGTKRPFMPCNRAGRLPADLFGPVHLATERCEAAS